MERGVKALDGVQRDRLIRGGRLVSLIRSNPLLHGSVTLLAWMVLFASIGPATAYADVISFLPWEGRSYYVLVENLRDYPEYVLLAKGHGTYTIIQPGESLPSSRPYRDAMVFYAIRKADFHEEEIGCAYSAVEDYFHNNQRLIRSGFLVAAHTPDRSDSTKRMTRVLRITTLSDETLAFEAVRDLHFSGNRGQKIDSTPPIDSRPPFLLEYRSGARHRIRIEGMTDYPDHDFIAYFKPGHKIMVPDRDIDIGGGRVYVALKNRLDPDDIPDGATEEWTYFAENGTVTCLPLELSTGPYGRGTQPAEITDVFQTVTNTDGQLELRPVKTELVDARGTVREMRATALHHELRNGPKPEDIWSVLAVPTEPEPVGVHAKRDSVRVRPEVLPVFYAHVQNLDSIRDFVLLHGLPWSYHVLAPGDSVEFCGQAIYAVPHSLFHPEQLKTVVQRRALLENPQVVPLEIDFQSFMHGRGPFLRKDVTFRLIRTKGTGIGWEMVRGLFTKPDGSSYVQDLSPAPPATGRHTATSPHGPLSSNPRVLPKWFAWLWFLILPLLALVAIGLAVFKQRTRRPGA